MTTLNRGARYTIAIILCTSTHTDMDCTRYIISKINEKLINLCNTLIIICNVIMSLYYVTACGASLTLAPSSMSRHTIIVPLVFWYTIVRPLELDLGHEDETNRHSVL